MLRMNTEILLIADKVLGIRKWKDGQFDKIKRMANWRLEGWTIRQNWKDDQLQTQMKDNSTELQTTERKNNSTEYVAVRDVERAQGNQVL